MGLRVASAANQQGKADLSTNAPTVLPLLSPHFLETPKGIATGRLGPGPRGGGLAVHSLCQGPQPPSPHAGVSWTAEALSSRWQALRQGFLGPCSGTSEHSAPHVPWMQPPCSLSPSAVCPWVPWTGWSCVPRPLEQAGRGGCMSTKDSAPVLQKGLFLKSHVGWTCVGASSLWAPRR